MDRKDLLQKVFSRPYAFMILSCALWLFCFRGYFFGQLSLVSDAVSYYEHIQFFLMNLMKGNFPLWDPYWSGGVPNDFFLRRICPYNPFYMIVIGLNLIGISYYYAYLIFLAVYLFVGLWGFYLLCLKLVKDEPAAFLSFVILLFSALSTRIFDSYMIFVVTPLAWFFLFLISFGTAPNRRDLWGLTFTGMILMTTYIPFYFLIILATMAVAFVVIFPDRVRSVAPRIWTFVSRQRVLAIFCAAALLLASVPGVLFFKDAGKGEIAIPGRHYSTSDTHALAVQNQADDSWAVPEEFFFSAYYHDLRRIVFAIVYVPCFAFLLLILGAGARLSRLMAFLALGAGVILLLTSPFGSPLYKFMRENVFIFKYFRNLHFLLWFALFPIFALFVGEMFRSIRLGFESGRKVWVCGWIVAVHIAAGVLLARQPDALPTTYATIILSAGFLSGYLFWPAARSTPVVLFALLVLVALQPMEVYSHFSRNAERRTSTFFYDGLRPEFTYQTQNFGEGKREGAASPGMSYADVPSDGLYYVTSSYKQVRAGVPYSILSAYEGHKFMAYDQVEKEGEEISPEHLAATWRENRNAALIESDYEGPRHIGDRSLIQPQSFDEASKEFAVTKGSTDKVELKTNFKTPKFLIFNDAFHKSWTVSVNGKREKVWRANGAFKGVFVPAGAAVVTYSYGSIWMGPLNMFLMVLFYGMFVVLCLWTKQPVPCKGDRFQGGGHE